MSRIEIVREYADRIIENTSSITTSKEAYIHSYGVAECCALIAGKRGLNTELSYISGLLHDIYAYKTGSYTCHSESGAEMVRPVLRDSNVFSEDEQKTILSAIFHHDNKDFVHAELDEVLKDADLLQPFLKGADMRLFHQAIPRLKKLLEEFGIQANLSEYDSMHSLQKKAIVQKDRRLLLADLSEKLALENICGEKTDNGFMAMIRYFPEDSACDELKNAWCGAFVYHCCLQAGMEIPIKTPPATCRFAGVGAWYEWSKDQNFCFNDANGFIPGRGDIVIYNKIVPVENKPENLPWHDHMGIVLECRDDHLIVAEGNVDNKNVSGVVVRKRDNTIGCYIRIPDDYDYAGWKYDYKTEKVFTEEPFM